MSGKVSMGNSPYSGRYADGVTPREGTSTTPRATNVSFNSEYETRRSMAVDHNESVVYKSSTEMHALRSIQAARAVVASERHKLLSKTQAMSDKPVGEWTSPGNIEPAKRASEEQLFEEVGLLMQERDLLLREKGALQTILASSADEIRRLFDAEQRHVTEMKGWLVQKDMIEHDRDTLVIQLEEVQKEVEHLRRAVDHEKSERSDLEKSHQSIEREKVDLQSTVSKLKQELAVKRAAEDAHSDEKSDWTRHQEEMARTLVKAQAEVSSQATTIQQLKLDADQHRKVADHWDEERSALLSDRAEKERLRILQEEHKQEQQRWTVTHEQLLKERSDATAQLQLSLQQMEQQQKSIDSHNQEKTQWLQQQEVSSQARCALESRNVSLEEEVARMRQQNTTLQREKDEALGRAGRLEQDLADSARHLATAQGDLERSKQQKRQLTEDLDAAKKELETRKEEAWQTESKLKDATSEVTRLKEIEASYAHDREERAGVEGRLTAKLAETQDSLRLSQTEVQQLQELSEALRAEVRHLTEERQALTEERSRLQYRLKLTLQELEHLRGNEKRYESESSEWLHTHSNLLERVLRHSRDGAR